MIKTVIFDIGNVLVPFAWKETFSDLFDEETAKAVAKATVLNTEMWNELDRGAMEDQAILESFITSAPEYQEEIIKGVTEIFTRMRPYPYGAGWLKALKKRGYRVYLLSNFGRTPFLTAQKTFDFLPYCDGAVISYQVEQIKPHPPIYHILCQKYRISPCEAVFIDDSPANIQAAKELGFSTILFEGFESACKQLADLHVYF